MEEARTLEGRDRGATVASGARRLAVLLVALAFLGAIAVGLVPVPTSAQLTQEEITRMSAQIAPAAIIAGDGIALPAGTAKIVTEEELRGFSELLAFKNRAVREKWREQARALHEAAHGPLN